MQMLTPEGFSTQPEIEAFLRGGPPLPLDRAKQIASEMVTGLREHYPRFEAVREAIRAIESLKAVVASTSATIVKSDAIVMVEPKYFPSPDHELAFHASSVLRQIVAERGLVTDDELESVSTEVYQRARQVMGDRAASTTMEGQSLLPLPFLRLRHAMEAMQYFAQLMSPATKALRLALKHDLFPAPVGGRPSLDLPMYFAWVLQDASAPRGMTDAHVTVFLGDIFGTLPPEWAIPAPSVSTVAKWRHERKRHPEIPHHKRPHEKG